MYLLKPCIDYILHMPIDLIKENGFTLKKTRNSRYLAKTMADADNTDDLTNTLEQVESQPHSLEQAEEGISL